MEIKMLVLQNKCEKCDGQGVVENPAMANSRSGNFGSHLVYATPVNCDSCHGRGFCLTESGSILVEFLRLVNSKHQKQF